MLLIWREYSPSGQRWSDLPTTYGNVINAWSCCVVCIELAQLEFVLNARAAPTPSFHCGWAILSMWRPLGIDDKHTQQTTQQLNWHADGLIMNSGDCSSPGTTPWKANRNQLWAMCPVGDSKLLYSYYRFCNALDVIEGRADSNHKRCSLMEMNCNNIKRTHGTHVFDVTKRQLWHRSISIIQWSQASAFPSSLAKSRE